MIHTRKAVSEIPAPLFAVSLRKCGKLFLKNEPNGGKRDLTDRKQKRAAVFRNRNKGQCDESTDICSGSPCGRGQSVPGGSHHLAIRQRLRGRGAGGNLQGMGKTEYFAAAGIFPDVADPDSHS